jgi:hypothetical protein
MSDLSREGVIAARHRARGKGVLGEEDRLLVMVLQLAGLIPEEVMSSGEVRRQEEAVDDGRAATEDPSTGQGTASDEASSARRDAADQGSTPRRAPRRRVTHE